MYNNISLSPHFELREFVDSQTAKEHGIVNVPSEQEIENLRALCVHTLEPLRMAMGLPIIITSGYRCKELNLLLAKHSDKSQHMNGQAADFYVGVQSSSGSSGSRVQEVQEVQGESHRELLIKAFRTLILDENINFDQLIIYPNFIHVSYTSNHRNRQKLTRAFANGSYCALSRVQALSLE